MRSLHIDARGCVQEGAPPIEASAVAARDCRWRLPCTARGHAPHSRAGAVRRDRVTVRTDVTLLYVDEHLLRRLGVAPAAEAREQARGRRIEWEMLATTAHATAVRVPYLSPDMRLRAGRVLLRLLAAVLSRDEPICRRARRWPAITHARL